MLTVPIKYHTVLRPCPNTAIPISRWSGGEFCSPLVKDRPTSEYFNSELKFAWRFAGVQQINSSGGVLRDACGTPAILRSATRGNLGCNWQRKPTGSWTENRQSPMGRWRVTQRWSAGNLDRESHPTASGGSPADVPSEIAGSSLDHRSTR